jgi:hypothetical protein
VRGTETVADTIDEDETMIMDNPGPAFFEADLASEYSLTFSLLSPLHAAGRKTLMWMRCFEEDKLRGAIVFLGERQHLWPEWRVIAEREGGNHLSAIIAELALVDARKRYGAGNYMFELCTGAKIENVGSSSIRLVMTLATRTLPIIEHAFADAATRTAFMEGQLFGDRFEGAVELAELALLRGRAALASRLDSIAAARAATHSRSVH